MAYLLDSGFLYAQLNDHDKWHDDVSRAVESAISEDIVLPVPAITEVAFLLHRRLGLEAVARFSVTLERTNLLLEMPVSPDFTRTAQILRKYNDANIDFVDALIVAMAERLNISDR